MTVSPELLGKQRRAAVDLTCAFRKSYPDVMAPRLSCINLQRGLLLPGFRTGRSPFPSRDSVWTPLLAGTLTRWNGS
jgi:hypothetical protein